MPSVDETVRKVVDAESWDQRVAQMRLIPQRHGTAEHPSVYATIARSLYVPHLAPDFAYVHEAPFYESEYFDQVYSAAVTATDGFETVDVESLTTVITNDSRTLLIFRTIMGLTKEEFSHSTTLVGDSLDLAPLTANKIDSMEKRGTLATDLQARVAAETLTRIIDGTLFGAPVGDLKSKQDKPDTDRGWEGVRVFADEGVPYSVLLHQRHYGGAFGQVLNATSTKRGDLIEDAVEALFTEARIPSIRTGSHHQAEINERFEVTVTPAPDFVVFDTSDTLRAMLECKGTNNGGTARDKALRFERLRAEAQRLGGIPLFGVLGGMGWARVNDTLGPVIRDTDGRVFTLGTLPEMLTVSPFPSLLGLAPATR